MVINYYQCKLINIISQFIITRKLNPKNITMRILNTVLKRSHQINYSSNYNGNTQYIFGENLIKQITAIRILLLKLVIIYFNDQMAQQSNLQIYEMFASLFVTISKGEQFIDSIKEVLTTFDLFHPLVLFKYLTKGNPILQRKHILNFLDQNNYSASQQDVKIIFSFEGVKDKINYTTFLKMIYPYSMSANRQISTVHIKNYHETQNLQVQEQTVACFFLFITEQIELINRIQVQKQDSFAQVPKQKIHKVLRNIKKLSQKPLGHCQKNPDVITGIQLIYFIKNFTNIDANSLLYLIRRLGTDHLGSIQIQKLQAFVKPWKKKSSLPSTQNIEQKQNISVRKRFNEQKYRQELNAQLSRNLSDKKHQSQPVTKRKIRKDGAIKIKQGQFCQKKGTETKQNLDCSPIKTPIRENQKSFKKKQKQQRPNGNNVKLFIKFISTFLKNSAEIQKLKNDLNRNNQINYLKIFKNLDKSERGVITSDQLQAFYQQLGGVNVSINFTVLITAFSQTSQFCQIFKPSIQRSQRTSSLTYSVIPQRMSTDDQNRTLSQILYLNLLNQHQLLQIRREFGKGQLFHLFSLINKEETGFINYQELKHFLSEINFTQLTMYELMLVLKRLDRCKNGVVSQNQFVDYFLVQM